MPKPFTPVVLTANDLLMGDAVWWTGEDWSREAADAAVADTPEAAETFSRLGVRSESAIVGAYLAEVVLEGPVPTPLSRRERIRAAGEPTFAYGEEVPTALDRAA